MIELLLVALLGASPAAAQEDPLQRAEAAYLNIDLPATLDHAEAALRTGSRSPVELQRIYELMGRAAAAQEGGEEIARNAYLRLLALNPDARLETDLSPRVRSPFLEARGYWASRPDRFSMEGDVIEARTAIRVRLSDPLGMASEIEFNARAAGQPDFIQRVEPAGSSTLAAFESLEGQAVEYYVRVLDSDGNTLLQLGDQDVPERFGESLPPDETEPTDEGSSVFASPWFWTIVGVVVVGTGVGLTFALLPEDVELRTGVSFALSE
ncbi:MAG: hypothetical protein AAGF12_03365 [Myxococcota bacterium]